MSLPHKKRSEAGCEGFTLVETLVAVLMLSVVMVAITSLLTRSLQAIAISQDYFIASKIALEGIEMMRTIRNNNLIAVRPDNTVEWDTNIAPSSGTTVTYEFDYNTVATYNPTGGTALPTLSGSPRPLCIGSATTVLAGRYTYTSSPACNGTNIEPLQGTFTRKIIVDDTDSTDPWLQVTVIVTVGPIDNPSLTYVITTILYNAS